MVIQIFSGRPIGDRVQTRIGAPSNQASAESRNVTKGAATLYGVIVDNQLTATGNTKSWIKLYDKTDQGWTPGSDASLLGFPVEQWTAADDSQMIGTVQACFIPEGFPVEKGLSIAASQEAGDSATTAPGADLMVELIT